MAEGSVLSHVSEALLTFALLSMPPLIAALVVGLVVGILQTATQIQDQTMPQIFKLLAVFAVFAALAPVLITPLVAHAQRVFTDFPLVVR